MVEANLKPKLHSGNVSGTAVRELNLIIHYIMDSLDDEIESILYIAREVSGYLEF
jgi:hypothetical protein